jgi:hypothetical protein
VFFQAAVVMSIKQFPLLLVESCVGNLGAAPVIGSLSVGTLHLLTATAESSRVMDYPQEDEIRIMTLRKIFIQLPLLASLLVAVSCNRSVVTGSRLTLSYYHQITTGMTECAGFFSS